MNDLVAGVRALVECESPSTDLEAIARSARVVSRVGAELLGVEPETLVMEGRSHLRWRLGTSASRVLVLGHHDTVWPLGSLERRPFAVEGDVLRGPGCFDMKAGLVIGLHALAGLDGVTILVTGDEEIGSPTSRDLIEHEARRADAVLVLEAAADGGALKTERKGVSVYEVNVNGRAAHAGLDPERGVNAAIELAHRILAVSQLGDAAAGTTVTPTMVTAGTAVNTVPAAGTFTVDVRVRTQAEQVRVDRALRSLGSHDPASSASVTGGPNRPPLEAAASAELYAGACVAAKRIGLPPPARAAVGGASDGNLTAGVGTPTLDGLGATGGGAHAEDEHVNLAELPGRIALVRALTQDLLAGGLVVSTNPPRGPGAARP